MGGSSSVNELFRMNEHGDIWQEPTLFDQGGDVPETSSSAPRDVWLCGVCGDAYTCALCVADDITI